MKTETKNTKTGQADQTYEVVIYSAARAVRRPAPGRPYRKRQEPGVRGPALAGRRAHQGGDRPRTQDGGLGSRLSC